MNIMPNSSVPSISFGGVNWPLSSLLVLQGGMIPAGGHKAVTLRLRGASAGYQVTAGKTLICVGMIVHGDLAAGANGNLQLGYGDTDVGINSGSDPTNFNTAFSGSTAAPSGDSQISGKQVIAGELAVSVLGAAIPAAKYPCVATYSNNTGFLQITMFAYEV